MVIVPMSFFAMVRRVFEFKRLTLLAVRSHQLPMELTICRHNIYADSSFLAHLVSGTRFRPHDFQQIYICKRLNATLIAGNRPPDYSFVFLTITNISVLTSCTPTVITCLLGAVQRCSV